MKNTPNNTPNVDIGVDLSKRKGLAQLIGLCVVAGTTATTTTTAWSGGTVSGFATEVTQWANYGLLTSQLNQQILMVANTLTSATSSLTNLLALPGQIINTITAPVTDVMASIGELQGSLTGLKSSVTEVGTVWQRRNRELVLLGENPMEYFRKQKVLADARGGFYKEQWESDISSANRLKTRAEKVQQLSREVQGVMGNLQGMQLLNSQLNIVATSMNDMLSVARKDSANKLQDRMDIEQARLIEAEREISRQEALQLQYLRHRDLKSGFKMPWEF